MSKNERSLLAPNSRFINFQTNTRYQNCELCTYSPLLGSLLCDTQGYTEGPMLTLLIGDRGTHLVY